MAELYDQSLRGQQAKELLDNPILKEALTEIRERLVQQLERTTSADDRVREQIWLTLRLVKSFKGFLEEAVNNGTIAQAELIAVEEERKRGTLYGLFNR